MTRVTDTSAGEISEGGRRSPWLMIGAGLGAATLIGGGVAAALMMSGAGDQPESVLPGDAAAYLEVDLDPSVGEKIAAVRFFQGLDPELRERLGDGQWREWAWEQYEENGQVPEGVSFAEDIEPWLGDRVGLAVMSAGADADPIVAVALQVKDGEAALAFLDGQLADDEETGYYLDGDYVVLSEADTLDSVRTAADGGTLAESESYTSDMEALGESGVASMWVDSSRLGQLGGDYAQLGAELGVEDVPDAQAAESMPELAGRFAATVRLTADAIEVDGVARGVDGMPGPGDLGAPMVTDLPADTAVALAIRGGASTVENAWNSYAETYGEELTTLAEEAESIGISLPEDLGVALGESMVISVGDGIVAATSAISPTDPSLPALPVAYRVTTDVTRAQQLLDDNGLGRGVLVRREDGGTLTMGTDQDYVDRIAAGGEDSLGSDPWFTSAVPDAENAHGVFYVKISTFEQFYLPEVSDSDARRALEQVGAIGMSGTAEGAGEGRFTLRVVADPQDG